MVLSEQELEIQTQDNVYETDDLIAQYCEFHYGNEYFSVKNFPVACVHVLMKNVQTNNITTDRALDLGCAVGRSSFELAKNFLHVDALDFSLGFVEQGAKLQAHNRLRYTVPVEGEIIEYK